MRSTALCLLACLPTLAACGAMPGEPAELATGSSSQVLVHHDASSGSEVLSGEGGACAGLVGRACQPGFDCVISPQTPGAIGTCHAESDCRGPGAAVCPGGFACDQQNGVCDAVCQVDTDCNLGSVCSSGLCQTVICPMIYLPVCGLDGHVYPNGCNAMRNHVQSVRGSCHPCQNSAECSGSEYCDEMPGVGGRCITGSPAAAAGINN